MSLFTTARAIYVALKDDDNALAAIRDARATLARSIATDANGALQITSATMNGQTFAAMQGLKPTERLRVLGIVCDMADAETVISTTVQPLL